MVLNGVEFRTRHNDYTLQMPSTTTKDYNAVEDIEFPPVPPEVLSKETVLEQIDEMREYFRGKTCLKRLLKNRQNKDLYAKWFLNEGRKYCRMLPLEHSAILLTCIKR